MRWERKRETSKWAVVPGALSMAKQNKATGNWLWISLNISISISIRHGGGCLLYDQAGWQGAYSAAEAARPDWNGRRWWWARAILYHQHQRNFDTTSNAGFSERCIRIHLPSLHCKSPGVLSNNNLHLILFGEWMGWEWVGEWVNFTDCPYHIHRVWYGWGLFCFDLFCFP